MTETSDCHAAVQKLHVYFDCFSLLILFKHVKLTLIDEYLPWLHSSNLGAMLDVLAISYVMLEW
jgi:hypothetical protein